MSTEVLLSEEKKTFKPDIEWQIMMMKLINCENTPDSLTALTVFRQVHPAWGSVSRCLECYVAKKFITRKKTCQFTDLLKNLEIIFM